MLTLLARHSLMDLEVAATGDLETGSHHTVEDVGITLGQALAEALGDRAGIERYGSAACRWTSAWRRPPSTCRGAPFAAIDVPLPDVVIGGFETEALAEFLRGLANHARLTLQCACWRPAAPTTPSRAA